MYQEKGQINPKRGPGEAHIKKNPLLTSVLYKVTRIYLAWLEFRTGLLLGYHPVHVHGTERMLSLFWNLIQGHQGGMHLVKRRNSPYVDTMVMMLCISYACNDVTSLTLATSGLILKRTFDLICPTPVSIEWRVGDAEKWSKMCLNHNFEQSINLMALTLSEVGL